MSWFSRRPPPPEVERAIATRDDLFHQADEAMKEVDRVQARLLAQYAAAEELRRKEI